MNHRFIGRSGAALVASVLLVGAFGCSGSPQKAGRSSAQFTADTPPPFTPPALTPAKHTTSSSPPKLKPKPIPKPQGDGLTGFGARDAAWEAHHTRDPNPKIYPGAAYDPDPNLRTASGGGDKYIAVMHGDGRVLDYSVEFQAGTTRADAIAEVTLEFPTDVGIVWQKQLDSCYMVEFRSATLAKVVPSRDISNGYVTAVFFHYDSQASPLPDTTVVDEMIFSVVPAPTPDGAAC